MTNDITTLGYKCNMKKCKSTSIEVGRYISELSSKAMSQPTPTISDKDIEKLGNYLDVLGQSCGIADNHMKTINKHYREIGNIYPTARGSRLLSPISDLMNTMDYADSICKCK